jgi:hypothetical protein
MAVRTGTEGRETGLKEELRPAYRWAFGAKEREKKAKGLIDSDLTAA